MARTTTVTHPDSTVSKRTSARAEYGFAVEVKTDMREQAEALRANAVARDEHAARCDAAALLGEVTEESRSWSRGATYTDVSVGGIWAGAYIVAGTEGGYERARETDEAYRAKVAQDAEEARANAADYRAKADALDAGPEFTYGVYRWSRTAALAEKGLREVTWLKGRSSARVVPVD
jgi:hypothetical protein